MSAKQRNSPQTVPVQDVASTSQSIEPDVDLSRAQKFVSYCSTRLPSNAFENFVGLLQQFFQEGSKHMSGAAFVEKVRGEFKNSNGHFAELCTSLAEFMPKELAPIFRSLATKPDMVVPEVHTAALQNWAALGKAYPRLIKEVPISPGANMDLGPDSPSDSVMGTDKLAALSDDSGSETDASVLSSPITTRLGDMRDGPAPSMTIRQDSGLIGQQLTGPLVPMSTDDLPPRAVTSIEGREQKDGCVQYLARHADGTEVWCRKNELKHVMHLVESYNKPRCATCQKTSRRVLLAQCSGCLQYHHPGCHIPAPHRPVPTDWRCSVCMSQPSSAFMLPSLASGSRKVTLGGSIQMLTNGTDHSDTDDVQEPPRKKARLSPTAGQNGTSVTVTAMDTASSSLIPTTATTTSDTSSTTTAMSDATVTVQSTGTPTITAKLEIALPTESSQVTAQQQLQLVTGQQQTVVASTAQTPVLHRQSSGITPAPRPRTSSKSKSGLRATKSFNSNEKLIIKFKNPAKMNANTPAGSPALGTPMTPATPGSKAGIVPMEMTSNQPNSVLSQSLGISLHVVPQSPINKKRGRPKTPGHSKRTTASKHKTPQPGRYLPDVPLYEQAGQLWTITVFPSPVNIYDSPECTHFFGIKGIPIPRNRRRHKPAAEEDHEAKDPSKKKKKVVGVANPKKKAVAPVAGAASNASSAKMDTSGLSETKSGSAAMQTSSEEKKTTSPKTSKAVGAEVKDVKSKPKTKPGPKAAGAKQSASSKQYQPTKKRKRIYSSDLDPSALHQMRQAYQLLEKAFPILQPTPPPTPAEKLAASAAAKLAEAENKYQVVQEPALPEKGYFVCLTRNGDTVLSAAYLDEAPEDSNTNNNSKKEKERPVLRLQFFAVPVEFQRYGYGRVLANYIVDLVRASNYTLLVCSLHSAVPFWRGKNVGNFETAPDEFKAHNCFPDTQLLILKCEKCGVRCACPQIVRKGPLDGMFAKTQKAFGDLKSLGRTRSRATQKDATELTVLSPHASPRHQARRPMDILLRFPVSLSVVQVEPPTPLPSTRIALEEALDDLSD